MGRLLRLGIFILLVSASAVLAANWGRNSEVSRPTFVSSPSEVVVRVGETAYLPCEVENLGDNAISWTRNRDFHLLAVKSFIYTPDSRFHVLRKPLSNKSTLRLNNFQHGDGGVYKCVVSTKPEMSQEYTLVVKDDNPEVENKSPSTESAGPGEDSCATTCGKQEKFNYKPGLSYRYSYESSISTGNVPMYAEKATLNISGMVHIQMESACEFLLSFSDIQLKGSSKSPEFSSAIERQPLKFSFDNGLIKNVCGSSDEENWVLNFKKGVLSLFQSNGILHHDMAIDETDISGTCKTHYSSKLSYRSNAAYPTRIQKYKTLSSCAQGLQDATNLSGSGYKSDAILRGILPIDSMQECTQTVTGDTKIHDSVHCMEYHKLMADKQGTSTNTKTTLDFIGTEPAKPIQIGGIVRRTDLSYSEISKEQQKSKSDIASNILVKLATLTTHGEVKGTPILFSQLVFAMKGLSSNEIISLFKAYNGNDVRHFLIDAMPLVGTTASIESAYKLVKSALLSSEEQSVWLSSLTLIEKPTLDMFKALLPILQLSQDSKDLYGPSSMIHHYCKIEPNCEKAQEILDVINCFNLQIQGGCQTSSEKEEEQMIFALKAIGNAGVHTNTHESLERCYGQEVNNMEVRLTAIQAFRKMSCDHPREDLLKLFPTQQTSGQPTTGQGAQQPDTEILIASYLQLMNCPSWEVVDFFKRFIFINDTQVYPQVKRFVYTHLYNLKETASAEKQHIRPLIQDFDQNWGFSMNPIKDSRNYESSMQFAHHRIPGGVSGGTAEANVIFSDKSILPRSAMMNLTINLFGESVNLFEIGGRMEGLEDYVMKLFGPAGYYPHATASEMVKHFLGANENMENGPKGSYYLKMFGDEVLYKNFHGMENILPDMDIKSTMDSIVGMMKGGALDYQKSFRVIDTEYYIPSITGLPINLKLNGTATLNLKMNTKFNMKSLTSFDVSARIEPSIAMQLDAVMVVDAFVTKSGFKMVSNLHSSMFMDGKIAVDGGKLVDIKFEVPHEKLNNFEFSNKFFRIEDGQDIPQEPDQNEGLSNYYKHCPRIRILRHPRLGLLGLEFCYEKISWNRWDNYYVRNFPFNGPNEIKFYTQKTDTHNSYIFRYTNDEKGHSLVADMPGSSVKRKWSANLSTVLYRNTTLVIDTPYGGLTANKHGYLYRGGLSLFFDMFGCEGKFKVSSTSDNIHSVEGLFNVKVGSEELVDFRSNVTHDQMGHNVTFETYLTINGHVDSAKFTLSPKDTVGVEVSNVPHPERPPTTSISYFLTQKFRDGDVGFRLDGDFRLHNVGFLRRRVGEEAQFTLHGRWQREEREGGVDYQSLTLYCSDLGFNLISDVEMFKDKIRTTGTYAFWGHLGFIPDITWDETAGFEYFGDGKRTYYYKGLYGLRQYSRNIPGISPKFDQYLLQQNVTLTDDSIVSVGSFSLNETNLYYHEMTFKYSNNLSLLVQIPAISSDHVWKINYLHYFPAKWWGVPVVNIEVETPYGVFESTCRIYQTEEDKKEGARLYVNVGNFRKGYEGLLDFSISHDPAIAAEAIFEFDSRPRPLIRFRAHVNHNPLNQTIDFDMQLNAPNLGERNAMCIEFQVNFEEPPSPRDKVYNSTNGRGTGLIPFLRKSIIHDGYLSYEMHLVVVCIGHPFNFTNTGKYERELNENSTSYVISSTSRFNDVTVLDFSNDVTIFDVKNHYGHERATALLKTEVKGNVKIGGGPLYLVNLEDISWYNKLQQTHGPEGSTYEFESRTSHPDQHDTTKKNEYTIKEFVTLHSGLLYEIEGSFTMIRYGLIRNRNDTDMSTEPYVITHRHKFSGDVNKNTYDANISLNFASDDIYTLRINAAQLSPSSYKIKLYQSSPEGANKFVSAINNRSTGDKFEVDLVGDMDILGTKSRIVTSAHYLLRDYELFFKAKLKTASGAYKGTRTLSFNASPKSINFSNNFFWDISVIAKISTKLDLEIKFEDWQPIKIIAGYSETDIEATFKWADHPITRHLGIVISKTEPGWNWNERFGFQVKVHWTPTESIIINLSYHIQPIDSFVKLSLNTPFRGFEEQSINLDFSKTPGKSEHKGNLVLQWQTVQKISIGFDMKFLPGVMDYIGESIFTVSQQRLLGSMFYSVTIETTLDSFKKMVIEAKLTGQSLNVNIDGNLNDQVVTGRLNIIVRRLSDVDVSVTFNSPFNEPFQFIINYKRTHVSLSITGDITYGVNKYTLLFGGDITDSSDMTGYFSVNGISYLNSPDLDLSLSVKDTMASKRVYFRALVHDTERFSFTAMYDTVNILLKFKISDREHTLFFFDWSHKMLPNSHHISFLQFSPLFTDNVNVGFEGKLASVLDMFLKINVTGPINSELKFVNNVTIDDKLSTNVSVTFNDFFLNIDVRGILKDWRQMTGSIEIFTKSSFKDLLNDIHVKLEHTLISKKNNISFIITKKDLSFSLLENSLLFEDFLNWNNSFSLIGYYECGISNSIGQVDSVIKNEARCTWPGESRPIHSTVEIKTLDNFEIDVRLITPWTSDLEINLTDMTTRTALTGILKATYHSYKPVKVTVEYNINLDLKKVSNIGIVVSPYNFDFNAFFSAQNGILNAGLIGTTEVKYFEEIKVNAFIPLDRFAPKISAIFGPYTTTIEADVSGLESCCETFDASINITKLIKGINNYPVFDRATSVSIVPPYKNGYHYHSDNFDPSENFLIMFDSSFFSVFKPIIGNVATGILSQTILGVLPIIVLGSEILFDG